MDSNIKEIVELCGVREKKEKLIKDRQRMFELDRLMSKATFDRNAGMYAFTLDKYYDLEQNEKENKKELERLASNLFDLEKLDVVLQYKKLREEYEILGYFQDDYYKCVNIDLRTALQEYKDPFIYVYQKDKFKNIISKEEYSDVVGSVIYPFYDMKSMRNFRHLYNKLSFKYLEELSQDYSFDLEGKKLGKMMIKKF